jgi:hypothetical protein
MPGMPHPLVEQLRFTRSEWLRALRAVTEEDGQRRFGPINPIGWTVGHLAWQEQRYWLTRLHGQTPAPELNDLVAYGAPPSSPSFTQMMQAWRTVTSTADPHLDALDQSDVEAHLGDTGSAVGTFLRRTTYHYWYHVGEIMAVRQLLDHPRRAQFVGDIDGKAPYRPE